MARPAQDLRLRGIKFEDAVKRMIATPPPAKKTKPAKTIRKPHQP